MFLKKNTKNLCSLLTLLAIFGLATAVLWLGANNTTNAASATTAAVEETDATFPGTGVGQIPDGLAGTPPQFGPPLVVSFAVSGVSGTINNISLDITMTHTWVGDVEVILRSPGGTVAFPIVSRIGATAPTSFGDSSNYGGTYTFNDAATGNITAVATAAACGDACVVTPGAYRTSAPFTGAPTNFTAAFAGLTPAQANGTWTLTFRDAAITDTGAVTAANLTITPTTGGPTPTPSATATATVTATVTAMERRTTAA